MYSLLDLMPCHPERLPIHSVCQICVYIFGGFAGCSTGNQSKSGKKKKKKDVIFLKSYNVCVDPETMYHVTWASNAQPFHFIQMYHAQMYHAQLSRQDSGLSAMFISLAIELLPRIDMAMNCTNADLWRKWLFLLLLLDYFCLEGHNVYGLYADHWPAGLFCSVCW